MTSLALKWIAVISMLIDHIGVALVPSGTPAYFVCRAIGRLAFPLFAYLIAEGYFYTKNYKRYIVRLLIFAAVSELPYDLLRSGSFPAWSGQNVLWTFAIALTALYIFDRFAVSDNRLPALMTLLTAAFAAQLLNTDYGAYGILLVFVFYFHRGRPRDMVMWYSIIVVVYAALLAIGQLPYNNNVILAMLNGLALFSLIPIILYTRKRKKGYNAPFWKYIFYIFYPAHMLVLFIISQI
jgi:hypothetical protein